jgi:hypothetical protein
MAVILGCRNGTAMNMDGKKLKFYTGTLQQEILKNNYLRLVEMRGLC